MPWRDDDVPDPLRSAATRWWLRRGLTVSYVFAAISVGLMTWASIADVETHEHSASVLGRWAILIGLLGGVCFVDVIGQRIIVRLTRVLSLFLSDVPPPPQRHARPRSGGAASVVELYREED